MSHSDHNTPGHNNADTDSLLNHEYDGIRELDNPTPGWWHAIFIATVLFSAVYYLFWEHSEFAWSEHDIHKKAQVAEYKRFFGELGDLSPDTPTMTMLMQRAEMMAIAESMYITNCAQCHAKDGGGINGVNLTDDHYKSVKAMPDIFTVITQGAGNGAMPAWRTNFSENERVLLAAFVASLRGRSPAAPRAPEGEVIPPWDAAR